VVKSEQGPVSFALGTASRIVDGRGQDRDRPAAGRSEGASVLHWPTEKRVIERVQVED